MFIITEAKDLKRGQWICKDRNGLTVESKQSARFMHLQSDAKLVGCSYCGVEEGPCTAGCECEKDRGPDGVVDIDGWYGQARMLVLAW